MNYLFPHCVLLIFCKSPVAGRVKTRLQPELTATQAVDAHIQLTGFTLDRAFQRPLCAVQLYCDPDIHHPFFTQCAKKYPLTLMPQQGDDLGARMSNALSGALTQYQHAVLIGCDCPSLTTDDLQRSFLALQNGQDVVVAPAEDGGYVLIGLSRPQPCLFSDMTWSNSTVMTVTWQRAARAGLTIHALAMQWDVDTINDWFRFLTYINGKLEP